MTRNLYALLVGIDDYDDRSSQKGTDSAAIPYSDLEGCLNDIRWIKAYLESRIDRNQFGLQLQTLTNAQATRQNIIAGFRQHLLKAGDGDAVLFYFAGHGRQAISPPTFWPVAQNRLLKTLVCYDSLSGGRQRAAYDLAHIELEQLISEVNQKKSQITVVLDCGYVGSPAAQLSGSRRSSQAAVRGLPTDQRTRPSESFIVSPQAAQAQLKEAQAGSATARGPVIFSACAETEPAAELIDAKRSRGAFSTCLQTSLAKSNGELSYLALFKRTNAGLLSRFPTQFAQLRAADADLAQPFLGGAIALASPYFTVSHHPEDGWTVDGGAVHGLSARSTRLALFPYYTPAEQTAQVAEAIAEARITEVHSRFSKIDGAGLTAAQATDIFRAVVTHLPMPPVPVVLDGDAAGVNLLRQHINTAGPARAPSAIVQIATPAGKGTGVSAARGRLSVQATNGAYSICPSVGDRLWTSPIRGYTAASAAVVVQTLEHIARWQTIVELDSPANSQIKGLVKLKIYTGMEADPADATEITAGQIRLSYRPQSTEGPGGILTDWMPERFRIKLHNTSNQALYCALFYLNDRFRAASIKPDSERNVVRLLPGEELWFAEGTALNGSVPDSLWQQGITECQESLKLLACVHEFDPTLLNLNELSQTLSRPADRTADGQDPLFSQPDGGSLNQLLYQVHHREAQAIAPSTSAQSVSAYDDWRANQITFTFVRPQLPVPLSNAESSRIVMGGGVISGNASTIESQTNAGWTVSALSHPSLKANAQLATVAQAIHELSSASSASKGVPPLSVDNATPFLLTPGRAGDAGLSVLVLRDVQQAQTVTPEHPLYIETNVPLKAGRQIVPVAFNGETYVPLGHGRLQNGQTQIVINRLPESSGLPSGDRTRSVSSNPVEHCDQNVLCIFLQQLDYAMGTAPSSPSANKPSAAISTPIAPATTAPIAAKRRMPPTSRSLDSSKAASGHKVDSGSAPNNASDTPTRKAPIKATAIGAAAAVTAATSAATSAAASRATTAPLGTKTPSSTSLSTAGVPPASSIQNTTRPSSAMQSPNPSNQPPNQPSGQPVNPPANPPVNPAANPAGRPLNQPLNQSAYPSRPNPASPPASPPVGQPVGQPPVSPAVSQPAQPVSQQPYQTPEADDVYAPMTERRPRSEVSPIMWAWVLVTGVLALIVAIAWIQYFQSWFAPAPEVAPATSTPVLPQTPAEPAEPPIAPESEEPDSET